MSNLKETEKYTPAKNINIGASQEIINRQVSDAVKQLNNHIRRLKTRITEIENSQVEKFKYLKGNLSDNRTIPNSNGEVIVKSSNNTIDVKISDNIVDLRVR